MIPKAICIVFVWVWLASLLLLLAFQRTLYNYSKNVRVVVYSILWKLRLAVRNCHLLTIIPWYAYIVGLSV